MTHPIVPAVLLALAGVAAIAAAADGTPAAGALSFAAPSASAPAANAGAPRAWAYTPVSRPPIPAVKARAWVRTPVDAYTTAAKNDGTTYYTSATGNAPKVGVSGLEIDGVYGGIPRTTLRFSGAYNKAVYKRFPNSAQPVENGDLTSAVAGVHPAEPYRSVNGRTLAGAPRFTFNVGLDYGQPVLADKLAHVSANVAYSSPYNTDVALSKYAVVGAQALVDLALGAGKRDKSFDVSVIVKNLFDNQTPQSRTWNSLTPATPRSYGIQFTGKL